MRKNWLVVGVTINKANKTGHVGLSFWSKKRSDGSATRYVVAVASPEPMRQVSKSFRIDSRPLEEVYSEALAWRGEVIEGRKTRQDKDKGAWDEALTDLLARGQKNVKASNRLKVFLCRSKDDKEGVRKVYMRLLAIGCQPWLESLGKWQWLGAYKDGYSRLIASLAQQTVKLGLDPLRVG